MRAALPQGPKSPQSRPCSAAVWRLCQRFRDKTWRKKIRIKSPRCCHPLVRTFEEGNGGERVGHRKREGDLVARDNVKSLDREGGREIAPKERVPFPDALTCTVSFSFQMTAQLERRFRKRLKRLTSGQG